MTKDRGSKDDYEPHHGKSLRKLQRCSTATNVLLTAVSNAAQGFAVLRGSLNRDAYIDMKRLRIGQALGRGAFGHTHRAKLAPDPAAPASDGRCLPQAPRPRDVVVKTLHKELLEDPEQVLLFVKEVELMKRLHHRHIVQLLGCSWQRSALDDSVRNGRGGDAVTTVYFVQEYCAGGSLGDLVRRQMIRPYRRLYSDGDALRWCLGVACALRHLHSMQPAPVMHRDLKLDNVMLSGADVAHADAKLADFGLARLTLEGVFDASIAGLACAAAAGKDCKGPHVDTAREQPVDAAHVAGFEAGGTAGGAAAPCCRRCQPAATAGEITGCTGSFCYMAPEVLRGQRYGPSADIFSLGMCMHNLFARTLPSFQILLTGEAEQLQHFARLVADGYRPSMPGGLPAALVDLIAACWKGDPDLRPSANAVVAQLEEIASSGVLSESRDERCSVRACCAVM